MKALGMFLGFKESNAESRMSQYETEQREPRRKVIRKMAESLGIVPEAITVPDIDTPIGLMHTLFALEDMYGLTIHTSYGRPCLCVLFPTETGEVNLQEYLPYRFPSRYHGLHRRISAHHLLRKCTCQRNLRMIKKLRQRDCTIGFSCLP